MKKQTRTKRRQTRTKRRQTTTKRRQTRTKRRQTRTKRRQQKMRGGIFFTGDEKFDKIKTIKDNLYEEVKLLENHLDECNKLLDKYNTDLLYSQGESERYNTEKATLQFNPLSRQRGGLKSAREYNENKQVIEDLKRSKEYLQEEIIVCGKLVKQKKEELDQLKRSNWSTNMENSNLRGKIDTTRSQQQQQQQQ